ncbi:hypothetical protein G7046_g9530 [Stylonectria norvegica]|nr:hypothetical protein G7046_g9530 [Stylonectria norvegica]
MSTTSHPPALRPLGAIELFSSTRHHLGIYRCVVVTCRYTIASPSSTSRIYAALASLIRAHPMLRVGILGQDTNKATFSHISDIDLRNHVEFRTIGGNDYEAELAAFQGESHDQLFSNIETQPPWKVTVLTPETSSKAEAFEDISLAFHHSLMDGTSGKNFHEYLLAAFNNSGITSSPEPQYSLTFPDAPILPEPQEEIIPFTNGRLYLARTLWAELGPSWLKARKPTVWAGTPVDFALPYKTRVFPVDFPPEVVASLLKECRNHATSITALLQVLGLASFSRRVTSEDATAFGSSTPINLRPYMSSTANPDLKNSFRVLISAMTHEFQAPVVEAFRSRSADLNALIWQQAQRIKEEYNKRASTLPADDIISLMGYIPDWFDFWNSKNGKPRADAWEVSSLGTVNGASPGTADRKITRIMFSNGTMVAGPAVGINIASVKGGALTAGISWCQGVVSDELVKGLAGDLVSFTNGLHQTDGIQYLSFPSDIHTSIFKPRFASSPAKATLHVSTVMSENRNGAIAYGHRPILYPNASQSMQRNARGLVQSQS